MDGPQIVKPMYRVSHQYGNTFNFNFLILCQCYCKSKTSYKKLRFKPSNGYLDFDFFLGLAKNEAKRNFFFGSMPPHPFFQNVPRFCFLRLIEFCFFFKSMYPGGLLFLLQIHVLGTWIWENKILGDFEKKGVGGVAPKKNSVLFCFLPTLKNNLIFKKKSKSRWSLEGLDLSFSKEVLLLQ